MDFTCFSKGFHFNTFRDIIIKGFNWIITRTQSHSCSWAIQHKSPLNMHYDNCEHRTTKCIIFTTSPIISTNQELRLSPKSRHFADDILISIKFFFIKNCGFKIRDSSVYSTGQIGNTSRVQLAIISANIYIAHRCVVIFPRSPEKKNIACTWYRFFCGFKVRFMFCCCHCSTVCNCMIYWTAI